MRFWMAKSLTSEQACRGAIVSADACRCNGGADKEACSSTRERCASHRSIYDLGPMRYFICCCPWPSQSTASGCAQWIRPNATMSVPMRTGAMPAPSWSTSAFVPRLHGSYVLVKFDDCRPAQRSAVPRAPSTGAAHCPPHPSISQSPRVRYRAGHRPLTRRRVEEGELATAR